MKKILFLFLSTFISLIIISCAKNDDSSSSSSSSGTTTTTTATTTPNACQIEGSTSRNDSLFSTPTLNRHTEQSIGRVLYVDKSALSQYQRDDYLLIDPFRSNSEGFPHLMCNRIGPLICDRVDLSDAAPILGNQFTLEARFYYEDDGDGHGQLLGSESFRAPSIGFHNHGKEIRYGFYTDSAVTGNRGRAVNLNTQKAWHHVATTFDGTNYKLFLDGELINNTTAFQGLTPPDNESVRIIGKKPWVGKIDEVRMWSVARTQAEIQDKMNKTLEGNETGLEAYYPMEVNNNWEIIDKTSNANHSKITNAEILSRYFSSDCPNGPDGTTSCPYPTIRSALDNATSGDHIYIRQGRYTELLNIRSFNVDLNKGLNLEDAFLKEEEKIVIEAYPNEEVIIDGTVALNDNSSNWVGPYSHELDNGTIINIYKTVINFDNITREIMKPVDNITQVFVNGRYMIPAMPMNFKNPTDPTTGNPKNPEPGTVWAGIGRSPFLYPASDNWTWGADADPRFGNYEHYFPGKLNNLDYPEEWAFDPQSKTLYLYASDNYTPTSTNVRVRVRDRVLTFRAAYNFEFKNIDFFAGSISLEGSSYWTFENSKFSFSADMGLRGNGVVYGTNMTIRNSIFEYINDEHSWSQWKSMYSTLENVLFRYNDWFTGSCWSPGGSRNFRGAGWSDGIHAPVTSYQRGDNHYRYVTIENSFTCGLSPGMGAVVEHSRIENLYDGVDSSGIQMPSIQNQFSTLRYNWIINAPGLNGLRFDSYCGGTNGDINNIVSIGNSRGFRLKGDFHDVYHVTAYDNQKQDISLPTYKYCGPDLSVPHDIQSAELGNKNSNLKNSIAGGSFECSSHDCWAEGNDPITTHSGGFNPAFDFPQLDSVGIWYGRALSLKENKSTPFANPHFELADPYIQQRNLPDSRLIEIYGALAWDDRNQSYDFRPKKGSYLIDSGVIIPGINDGKDEKDEKVFLETKKPKASKIKNPRADREGCTIINHPQSYPGQNRKYVGDAPDIGAYEYGDTVYWIPGFRYTYPSVPIPNDNASDVPVDYSLVWNYPYKKDYSNTEAKVTLKSGTSVIFTNKVFKYPYNVHFQAFQPGGTYNWSVTVDNISGGNWSFKVDEKIYPLNDRSVDVTDNKSLMPYQIKNLEVSNNKISFLRFDIPSSITDSHKIKLNLVIDGESTLNGRIAFHEYDQLGWGENPDNKNIGIIDHSLGATIATLTSLENGTTVWDNGTAQSLDNGTTLSIDLTDKITSYGGEYSVAIRVLETTDKVTFFSKEKKMIDRGFSPQMKLWPNLSFK